jgi:hypothetical protein
MKRHGTDRSVTRLLVRRQGLQSSILSIGKRNIAAHGFTQPAAHSVEVKRPEGENSNTSPCNAEIKNIYVFMG